MSILISAVICTYNRATYLKKAIQSLMAQNLKEEVYEILIVDNNSTDNTKKTVIEFSADVHNIHYIFEPIQGLSKARNTGLAEAKGEYVAYLDDDAIAEPDWLESILSCFEAATSPLGCVGGKIDPIWEAPCPEWLPDNYLSYLTILDWGPEPILIDSKKYLAGANMAFPTDLLRKLGGFNVELGRQGKKLLSSEEVWLQETIRRHSHDVYYDPSVVVKHHAAASRLVPDWFFQRLYWQGISNAFLDLARDPAFVDRRTSVILEYIKRLFTDLKDYIYFCLPVNHPHRFHRRCIKLQEIGYLWGLISLAKNIPSMPTEISSLREVTSLK
ncbi:MAG: glycosyltransferase family 2 protein [Leptolyngbya sp. SIO3F4]|nr:glycosyltransferase family 2 protein [Leptolyngbya sp. SIO3F4]